VRLAPLVQEGMRYLLSSNWKRALSRVRRVSGDTVLSDSLESQVGGMAAERRGQTRDLYIADILDVQEDGGSGGNPLRPSLGRCTLKNLVIWGQRFRSMTKFPPRHKGDSGVCS
jgi:hypothetical protein